jgi:L-methionine (R)-S-oxide reductase
MSSNDTDRKALMDRVKVIAAEYAPVQERLRRICEELKSEVRYFDWVGFYVSDPDGEGLTLGPYMGAPTDHVRIPFGKGICGQAAALRRTFIVQDVTKEDNYLSCSPEVRSEIVVPIMDGNTILGELDIDSHAISPFTDPDRSMLEEICNLCAPLLMSLRAR